MTGDTTAPVDKPEPSESAPTYLVEGLGKQDADTLCELADNARWLAEWQAVQAVADLEEQAADIDGAPDEWDDEAWDDAIDEAHEKADLEAGKGTLTVKQIDGRGMIGEISKRDRGEA